MFQGSKISNKYSENKVMLVINNKKVFINNKVVKINIKNYTKNYLLKITFAYIKKTN